MRILRLLSSRPLVCGCLLGIYETYAGPIVWILDARGTTCTDPTHRPGAQVEPATRPDTEHSGRTAA
jgi:hypothetical protein